ncbi:MAG: U32 family peptidase [Eggerthellaceae bacterium]|nr:U32 family peptidase [Eggerthellaceae bacterium]
MAKQMTCAELLAPAGNFTALRAAVCGGANAVYLGLDKFNARRGAQNFSLETFKQACDYAHLRNVKIYVTLNIAILPEETNSALEYARFAWMSGADAFIVQDISLANELRRQIPDVRIHISTQMNTHNEAGIRAAKRLGAKRVTLARELSSEEIARLCEVAHSLDMEVETFIHGALCVCYSGQCLMSSMIGGRSANRGMCAQACRLPYDLKNESSDEPLSSEGEHLLSPKDLCAISLIPRLLEAGVDSFKIEGRMKSPEYVLGVTSVYRGALDRIKDNQSKFYTEEDIKKLSEAFSRGFTTAYAEGHRGNDIMSYGRPNNRGINVGRVTFVSRNKISISSNVELSAGDVLEFWTLSGNVTHVVSEFEHEGKNIVSLPVGIESKSMRVGDRVFRVRSAQAAFDALQNDPRIGVHAHVTARIGMPLHIEFKRTNDISDASAPKGTFTGDIVEAARTKAVTEQEIAEHVGRMGAEDYVLENIDIDLDEGVGIGFSSLHAARREALANLTEAILAGYSKQISSVKPDKAKMPAASVQKPIIVAWATNPACASVASKAGADTIYVPALNETHHVLEGRAVSRDGKYPTSYIPAMPTVCHEQIGSSRENVVSFDPWKETKQPVFVDSLGDMQKASEMGIPFEVGPHVPITNKLSLELAASMGAHRVWLSPELNLKQIEELGADTPVSLGLTISGNQELMITEHCLLMGQGPCNEQCASCTRRTKRHALCDRKNYEFPIVTDICGRSHLFNGIYLDIVPAIPELLKANVSAFMVDTTLLDEQKTKVAVERARRALDLAIKSNESLAKLPQTTSGHLYRGVV